MKNTLLEKISPIQLFILLFLSIQGSAVVVGVGNEAKQDAWIAVFIATCIGIGLFLLYFAISTMHPNKTLFEIMEVAFGRKISVGLSLLFIEFFFYVASRVLRDFCELISTVSFSNTPITVLAVVFAIVISYILYLGIEVLGRTSEIFFPYTTGFLFLITIFLYFGKQVHLEYIKPILAHGVKPLAQAIFPGLMTFPFGEVFVFTSILGFVQPYQKARKAGLISVITTGLVLTYYSFIKIAVLSQEVNQNSIFPLLSATRQVSLANFIERIDALVVFVVMMGIFIKVSIFLFAALKGIEFITKLPYRLFVVPVCLLNAVISVLIATNYEEHIKEGLKIVTKFLHFPLTIIFPVILYLTLLWKRKRGKGGNPRYGHKKLAQK